MVLALKQRLYGLLWRSSLIFTSNLVNRTRFAKYYLIGSLPEHLLNENLASLWASVS